MSSLGQYVHITWEQYQKSGTFELQKKNPKQQNNFKGAKLFNQHRQMILSAAGQLREHNLKALEKKYNQQHAITWKKFTDLVKKAKSDKHGQEHRIVSAILANVNSAWKQTRADQIIAGLQQGLDGTMKYTGGSLAGLEYKTKIIDPIPWQKGKKTYIGPLWAKVKEIETYISRTEKESDITFTSQRMTLKTIQSTLQEMATTVKLDEQGNVSKISGIIPAPTDDIAPTVIDQINGLIGEFSVIEEINKQLRYQLPEILGQTLADFAPFFAQDYVEDELESYFKTFKRTGKGYTVQIEKKFDIYKGFNKNVLNDSIRINGKDTYGEAIWDVDQIGEGRQGKTDITFWGKAISLKTTDMGVIDFSKQAQKYTPAITLQGSSSILLYLMGIEQWRATWGTHYMNILAQHPDEDGAFDSLKQIALDTLKMHLLYSAITGAHQLRQGQQADVFAIYDTKSAKTDFPQVRFYDMSDIILSANKNLHAVILTPTLESISSNLLNRREPFADSPPSREAAQARISKLLVQLRNHTVKVSLSKHYLQNLYMIRNTAF